MFTCNTHTTQTLEVKQSKFITHLTPIHEFDTLLAQLKHEHPKARHFVTAFRSLNEYDQIVEGSSDDGEPKGTSGKPSLHVLQGHELINTAVIIVRYFGGTRLGTGGLVRAYSDAVNICIEAATLEPYEKQLSFVCSCSYNDLGRVEYLLAQCDIVHCDKSFEANAIVLTLSATQEQIAAFQNESGRLIRIEKN